MDTLNEALQQGIAPAIVVVVYLVITKIIDVRREKVQIKLSTELTKSINTISEFVFNITKNIIDKDKDKCKIAIEDSINASAMRLINFVTTTIINNHIDLNKSIILANIHNIINAEYYNVYSTLSMYKINNRIASSYLDKMWLSDVEKDIVDIIYNDKLSKEDKIVSFNNKINIKFQSYITYVTNNVIL